MKIKSTVIFIAILTKFGYTAHCQSTKFNSPIVTEDVLFEETKGLVAIEGEFFYKQSMSKVREWYRTSKDETPCIGRDGDTPHCYGASNNAYVEILPDERITHSDSLKHGVNFSKEPGKMAVIHYKVKFNNPGRYYVWVRAMSTGSEDNGIHVGLNGDWPESGKRMQWCKGKTLWTWESKQRTKEKHCGIPHAIYLDIDKSGVHDIQFSMREDGFEMDKFILTNDADYVPAKKGPAVKLAQGKLPQPFTQVEAPQNTISYFQSISSSLPEVKSLASQEFPVDGTNFYKNGKNWLAINPKKHKEAKSSITFPYKTGKYDIIFVGVGENDGRSTFTVLINGKELGTYNPPLTEELWVEGKDYNALWENIKLKKDDKITVIGQVATDGNEWTRARWAGLVFTPSGLGKAIQIAQSTDLFIK